MGDRVLFQVINTKDPKEKPSPVVYGHWHGSEAPAIVERLQARMQSRGYDLPYTAARLVQEVCGNDTGNLSVGIWSTDHRLNAEDSHGDGGVVILDANGAPLEAVGGYLTIKNGKLVAE